jgi:hypothetical protein
MTDPGRVIKIRLSDFTRVGALTFEPGEGGLYLGALIYPPGDRAYFGTWTFPGRVVQIRLSDFTRVDQLTLTAGSPIGSAVMEPTGTFAYFATGDGPGVITKVFLSPKVLWLPLVEQNAIP